MQQSNGETMYNHPSGQLSFRPSFSLRAQRWGSLQTAETTLADYVVAMAIDAPQLKLYSHVVADLQRWIEHSK
jgi:hypothetical protein